LPRWGGHVGLVNGPVAPPATTPAAAPTEPPYRDIAVSDLRVRVRHPQVQLNLGPLDVDVVNARDGRILVGLLVPRGDIRSIYYTGPLRRLETRLAVTSATGAVRVAFAQLVTPRSSVVLRDARYDPVAEEISLGARVELQAEDVTGGLRKHLSVPYFEGHVGVDAEARVRLAPFDFSARGEVTASGLGLRAPDSQTHEVLRYNVADSARMRVEADPHRIVVTDLHAAYAGAVLRSERVVVGLDHVPEAPRLGSLAAKPGRAGGPGVAGALRIEGLDFTRLMHDVTITPGTIVQWQLGGEVRVQGSFDPLRLTIDLPELESRDFAILAKPFTHLPQEPLLRIPRARLSGRMEVDDVSVSWNDVRLAFGQSTARVDRGARPHEPRPHRPRARPARAGPRHRPAAPRRLRHRGRPAHRGRGHRDGQRRRRLRRPPRDGYGHHPGLQPRHLPLRRHPRVSLALPGGCASTPRRARRFTAGTGTAATPCATRTWISRGTR
jgi:hypothetical protein